MWYRDQVSASNVIQGVWVLRIRVVPRYNSPVGTGLTWDGAPGLRGPRGIGT